MENLVYHWLESIKRKVLTPTCIACNGRASCSGDLCAGCKTDLRFNACFCVRCAIPLAEQSAICGTCMRLPPRYQYSYCAFEYGYPIAEFVRKLKYGYSLSQAQVLGQLLAEYLHQHHHTAWPNCIVPVPLSTPRYHERGFNQAIEIFRFNSQLLATRSSQGVIAGATVIIRSAPFSHNMVTLYGDPLYSLYPFLRFPLWPMISLNFHMMPSSSSFDMFSRI